MWEPIQIYNVWKIHIKCEHKTPEQVKNEILDQIKGKEFNNTIVLMRVSGVLESGKPYDIKFRDIFTELYNKSAYFVMKSTSMVKTKDFEEIKIDSDSPEDVENILIKEHLGQVKIDGMDTKKEEILIKDMITALNSEKKEGETNADFERRMRGEIGKVLDIELK